MFEEERKRERERGKTARGAVPYIAGGETSKLRITLITGPDRGLALPCLIPCRDDG